MTVKDEELNRFAKRAIDTLQAKTCGARDARGKQSG
jgi:hypothetical protein